jgi:hypothetical protein
LQVRTNIFVFYIERDLQVWSAYFFIGTQRSHLNKNSENQPQMWASTKNDFKSQLFIHVFVENILFWMQNIRECLTVTTLWLITYRKNSEFTKYRGILSISIV